MLLIVTAKTGKKEEKIIPLGKGLFEVWTKKQPIENKANNDIILQLSKYFKIPKSSIKLSKGETSKKKTFEVLGL